MTFRVAGGSLAHNPKIPSVSGAGNANARWVHAKSRPGCREVIVLLLLAASARARSADNGFVSLDPKAVLEPNHGGVVLGMATVLEIAAITVVGMVIQLI